MPPSVEACIENIPEAGRIELSLSAKVMFGAALLGLATNGLLPSATQHAEARTPFVLNDASYGATGLAMAEGVAQPATISANTLALPASVGGRVDYLGDLGIPASAVTQACSKEGDNASANITYWYVGSANTASRNADPSPQNREIYRVNLDNMTKTLVSHSISKDFFCGIQAIRASGDILSNGGTLEGGFSTDGTPYKGECLSFQLDPTGNGGVGSAQETENTPNCAWYPTLVTLPNGDIFTAGGVDETGSVAPNKTFIFKHDTQKWVEGPAMQFPLYPHFSVLNDGSVFFDGGYGNGVIQIPPMKFNPYTGEKKILPGIKDPYNGSNSASIPVGFNMQSSLVVGGGGPNFATKRVAVWKNLNTANPTLSDGPDLKVGAVHPCPVVLPTGEAVEMAGSTTFAAANGGKNVLQISIYNPASNSWTQMNTNKYGHSYHNTCELLKDGTIALENSNTGGAWSTVVEKFTPPNLLKGNTPQIYNVPLTGTYGGSYDIVANGGSKAVTHITFTRLRAGTHEVDADQRVIDIPFTKLTNGSTRITIPNNPNLLPPGCYLAWVVASDNSYSRGLPITINYADNGSTPTTTIQSSTTTTSTPSQPTTTIYTTTTVRPPATTTTTKPLLPPIFK